MYPTARPFVAAAIGLLFSPLLVAQSWSEAGDAGATMATAQPVFDTPVVVVDSIFGITQHSLDVDLYVIQVDRPDIFTVVQSSGPYPTPTNLSLYLFDEQGRAITGCENWSPAVHTAFLSGLNVPGPGRYYLAVAPDGVYPVSARGRMWPAGFLTEAKATGDGGREPLQGWAGLATSTTSNYHIIFPNQGCRSVHHQVHLPGDHHLTENPTIQGSSGNANYWPIGDGRFQILYEGSEFVAAGITGPINPRRLHFRGEDGRVNLGGVHYSYAVRFCATSLTTATMTNSFATNLAPATTTLFTETYDTAIAGASIGSTPNNHCLSITDTSLVMHSYNPTGPRPNLLVEVRMTLYTFPPAGTTMLPWQDASGANLRGRGLVANSNNATTGTFTNPLAIALEYEPNAGTTVPPLDPLLRPARNERIGAACGGDPASFYEAFLAGQAFDLDGLTLTPDNPAAPTRYTVTRGAAPFSSQQLNAAADSTGDDAVVTKPLGFAFAYPGGSTTSIAACTNGYVWLNGASTFADFSPSTAEFLGVTGGLPARLAPFWYDFHCGRNPGLAQSGLHVRTDTSGGPGNAVCYITWYRVGVFGSSIQSGTAVHDLQCVLHQATGVVEFRYGSMPRFCANTGTQLDIVPAMVGFSRGFHNGAPSADPQTRDLSIEVPFTTGIGNTGNMGITCVTGSPSSNTPYGGRLWPGQNAWWRIDNIPAGTLLGVQLLSLEQTQPGLQIPTITAPGCMLSTGINAVLWEVHTLPPASLTTTSSLAVPGGALGARLTAQYVVLDGLFGGSALVTKTSPALVQTVGRQ